MSIASAPTIVPVLIVVGMVLTGGVYLAYLLIFKREVLAQEPGAAVIVDATPVCTVTSPKLRRATGDTTPRRLSPATNLGPHSAHAAERKVRDRQPI